MPPLTHQRSTWFSDKRISALCPNQPTRSPYTSPFRVSLFCSAWGSLYSTLLLLINIMHCKRSIQLTHIPCILWLPWSLLVIAFLPTIALHSGYSVGCRHPHIMYNEITCFILPLNNDNHVSLLRLCTSCLLRSFLLVSTCRGRETQWPRRTPDIVYAREVTFGGAFGWNVALESIGP